MFIYCDLTVPHLFVVFDDEFGKHFIASNIEMDGYIGLVNFNTVKSFYRHIGRDPFPKFPCSSTA